jgi:tetratricopeptide (TPR) repeat protein
VPTSFFEAELFEAALLGKPSFFFALRGYEPEGKLANLMKLLGIECEVLSEDQIVRKIEGLVKHFQRPRWLRHMLAAPNLQRMMDTLIEMRHRSYDPRSSPPPFRFLEGARFDSHIGRLDAQAVELVLDRAYTAESHQTRLTLTWFAIRALMAAPYDDPRYKEFIPLWVRPFGVWANSATWYGLHGYCVMSHLAALGTLADIGFHSAREDDAAHGLPHGALASEYYSIAKLTSRPDPFFDLALTHIQLGMHSNAGDTTNQLAIKASILLGMKRFEEALKDYERVAKNRKEFGGQAYGEGLSEWGYALLKTRKKSEGVARMEAGMELLKAGSPSGFQVRALRKLAEGYLRCGEIRAALDCAVEAHEVAVKIGAYDQIGFLERFAKKIKR